MTTIRELTRAARGSPFDASAAAPAKAAGTIREDRLASVYGPAVLLAVALCLLALLWGLVLYDLRQDRASALAAAVKENEILARALEEHVVRTFMNADQLAWSLKQHIERSSLPDDMNAFVADRIRPGSPFLVVGVADENGMLVRNTLPTPAFSIAEAAHFRAHLGEDHGKLAIGHPIVGRLSGKRSLYVSRRINKPEGSFGGVASVAIDQSYFSHFYAQMAPGSSKTIALVGRDGIVRAAQGADPGSVTTAHLLEGVFDRIAEHSVGWYVEDAPAQPGRIVAYRALSHYPLVVVVGASLDDALAQYADHRSDYLVTAALLSVFLATSFCLLGYLMQRQRRAARLLEEANERAESANRVKSEFLANMTHELRTPLNGIMGFAECLRDELSDESQRECARIIHASGSTLLAMVNSALDLAKIEAGKMTLDLTAESLPLLLEEVVALHNAAATRKGLHVALRIDAAVPELLVCDRAKLQQVLNNLLHNAVKFTAQGEITVSVSKGADGIEIAVKDSGCGIAPELQNAIFERFRQLDNQAVGVRGGTGLGLALARDLVHLMGGRVDVDSRPSQGAEFRVSLPTPLAA